MGRPAPAPIVEEVVRTAPDWSTVDQAIASALQEAELDAEAFANGSPNSNPAWSRS